METSKICLNIIINYWVTLNYALVLLDAFWIILIHQLWLDTSWKSLIQYSIGSNFPLLPPAFFFLPGQPAKFLLVPSSFRAFLASSSLLAEDLTWHVACLLCPHPTHEFPAFEHLLLPMPAIHSNSWGLRFWMAWVQMAFQSCCHYNHHLFQHTLRHWKASRLKCLDAGRVDENWWNITWTRIRHPSDMDVLMKKFRQSGTENCHLSIKLIVNHKSVWNHNLLYTSHTCTFTSRCHFMQLSTPGLVLGFGYWWRILGLLHDQLNLMAIMVSTALLLSNRGRLGCWAHWTAGRLSLSHCSVVIMLWLYSFWMSFFFPNVFHTCFQLFFGNLFFIPGRPSVLAGCPVVGSQPWYGKQIRMSWSKRGISTCWIGVPAATGNWKFTWKVRFPKI